MRSAAVNNDTRRRFALLQARLLPQLRLSRRATIAAVITALFAFIAATAIASESASATEIPPDPSASWKYCTTEGGTCQGLGTGISKGAPYSTTQVRYGDYDIPGCEGCFGRWTIQTRQGNVACTNAVFGDPFPNRAKHCEYDASAAEWVYARPKMGPVTLAPTAAAIGSATEQATHTPPAK